MEESANRVIFFECAVSNFSILEYILHCGIKFVHTAVLQAHKWLFEFCSDVLCKNHSRVMNANFNESQKDRGCIFFSPNLVTY